jgi:hypothetical protein
MDQLIIEIKKSLPYNPQFHTLIQREEILKCVNRCKTVEHASIFIKNLIQLEDTLKTNTFQNLIDTKYSYNGLNEPLFKELLDCRMYIKEVLTGEKHNYSTSLTKEFFERLYLRIVLLKEGWRPLNIETFLKTNYSTKWDIVRYKFTYIYLRCILGIPPVIEHQKGRPKLPSYLKTFITHKLKEKNKDRMKHKYDISKDLNQLFTKQDITVLINSVKDNATLVEKLGVLNKYTL